MSSQLEAFLNCVQQSPELQERLGNTDLSGVLKLAKDLGFQVSAADLLKAQAQQILEMDDDALEKLAAGGIDDLMQMNDFQSYLNRF